MNHRQQFASRRSVGRMYCLLCAAHTTGVLGIQAGEDAVTAMQRHLVASHSLQERLAIDMVARAFASDSDATVVIRRADPPASSQLSGDTPHAA
jgi:hypothetical protein